MRLIEFPEQTIVIAKDQPEYLPMPAYVADDKSTTTICCWKLSIKERLQLLLTGKLWHRMLTFGQPMQPQLLQTYSPFITK